MNGSTILERSASRAAAPAVDATPERRPAEPETPRRRRLIWVALSLASILLAFALDEWVARWVHENFNENTRPIPTALKLPHRILRTMENWGENIFVLCVLVAMWRLDRENRHRVFVLVLSALIVAAGVEGLKRVAGRPRPLIGHRAREFLGPSKGFAGGDYQSFPSGHAAAGGAFSGSLWAFYPPLRPLVVTLAVGCGASRVWKERHYVSDVWVGGLIGFGLSASLPHLRLRRRA